MRNSVIAKVFCWFFFGACMLPATTYVSNSSGNLSSSATWTPAGVPASGDRVIIAPGSTVTNTSAAIVGDSPAAGVDVITIAGNALTSLPTTGNNFTGYLGYQISVGANPLSVTALGAICLAGNSGTHDVWIQTTAPATVAHTTVNLTGCTPGTLTGPSFVYASVSATLSVGTSYYVWVGEQTGDTYLDELHTIPTVQPGFGSVVLSIGSSAIPPAAPSVSFTGNGGHAYGIPNFLTTNGPFISSVGIGSARLINQNTLTVQGDIEASFYGTLEMQGDSVTQFSSPSSTAYRFFVNATAGNPENVSGTLLGTATSWAHPAIMQTKSGNAGNNGYISMTNDSTLNIAYTKLLGLGDGSRSAINSGGDLISSHVLMNNSGGLQWTAPNADVQTFNLDHFDVRNSLTSAPVNLVVGFEPPVTNISNSTIMGPNDSSTTSLNLQLYGLTVSNSILETSIVAATVVSDVTFSNVLIAGRSATDFGVSINDNANLKWNGGSFWVNESSFNPHYIDGGNGNQGAGPNNFVNLAVDGNGNGNGDLYVFPAAPIEHYLSGIITANGAGNVDDGTGADGAAGVLNHVTAHNTVQRVISLSELGASTNNKIRSVRNFVVDDSPEIAGISSNVGLGTTWVPQANFTYDYLWFSHPTADGGGLPPLNPWNPTTSHQGTLSEDNQPGEYKDTVTVLTHTDDTHLIVSSTTNIALGDWMWDNAAQRSALVLAIPLSGHVTLGFNEDGVPGLPSATVSTSLNVLPNIWASGIYGDTGKGPHEFYNDPRFVASSRTVATWDTLIGGPGTKADARDQILASSGWDVNGNAVTPNSLATLANYITYMRGALMASNLSFKGQANDAACATSTAYVAGQTCLDTNRHLQLTTVAGTTASSQPAWNGIGGSTVFGTATFQDQGVGVDPGAVPMTVYNAPGITGGGVY